MKFASGKAVWLVSSLLSLSACATSTDAETEMSVDGQITCPMEALIDGHWVLETAAAQPGVIDALGVTNCWVNYICVRTDNMADTCLSIDIPAQAENFLIDDLSVSRKHQRSNTSETYAATVDLLIGDYQETVEVSKRPGDPDSKAAVRTVNRQKYQLQGSNDDGKTPHSVTVCASVESDCVSDFAELVQAKLLP
ncbi:MAG: hypothetical protein H6715_04875 [Myxococcales bacterium]|nr:hypothetical protein [Myxococcales bacterium]MCB9708494.1 hypothetical protein [Myxococcales bacterium]